MVHAASTSAGCQANRHIIPSEAAGGSARCPPLGFNHRLSGSLHLKIANKCELEHESAHVCESVIIFLTYAVQVLVLTVPQLRS